MLRIWGDTEDAEEAARNSFEKNLEKILREFGSINLDELLKIMWGGYNLLSNYQSILENLKHLVEEGKIIRNGKIISLAKITILDEFGLKEKPIWELIKKEEEIEEKKEIIRRYNQINVLN